MFNKNIEKREEKQRFWVFLACLGPLSAVLGPCAAVRGSALHASGTTRGARGSLCVAFGRFRVRSSPL